MKYFILLCILITIFTKSLGSDHDHKSFYYFAYGSNMLKSRIHINNPSAEQKHIGKIKDYRLDFIGYSNNWNGSVSTIVPDLDSEVWGVVWKLNITNINSLDKQEGVYKNIYFPKYVYVSTLSKKIIKCRVYQSTKLPTEYIEPEFLPVNRQPSLSYLNTIINGSIENNLPSDYINFLKSFKYIN